MLENKVDNVSRNVKVKRWNNGSVIGCGETVRAVCEKNKNRLRCVDLQDADLQDANLQGADLRYADLTGANLQGADLRGAKILSGWKLEKER